MPRRKREHNNDNENKASVIDGKCLNKIRKLQKQMNEEEEFVEEKIIVPIKIENKDFIKSGSDGDESASEGNMSDVEFEDDENDAIDEEAEEALKCTQFVAAKTTNEKWRDAKQSLERKIEDNKSINSWTDIYTPEHFELFRNIMKSYTPTDRMPKLCRIMCQLHGISELLDLMDFPNWSEFAVEKITVYFRARGGDNCELYYFRYLLPYLRNYIREHRILHKTLFRALCSTLFNKQSFATHLLRPWLQDLNGREADILSNVLKTHKLSSYYMSCALYNMLQTTTPSKPRLIIMQTLISKKYNLESACIPALINFFHKSLEQGAYPDELFDTKKKCPSILWFTALHELVLYYRINFSGEDCVKLQQVCDRYKHPKFTPQISEFLRLQLNEINQAGDVEMK